MVRDGHVGGRYALPSFSRFFLVFDFVSAMLHVHELLIFMPLWLRAIRVATYTQTYNIAVSQQRFLCINAADGLPSKCYQRQEHQFQQQIDTKKYYLKHKEKKEWEHEEKGNTKFFCRYLLNKRTAQMYLSKLFSDVISQASEKE